MTAPMPAHRHRPRVGEPRSNVVRLVQRPANVYDWEVEQHRSASTTPVGWSLVLEGLRRLHVAAADELAADLVRQLRHPSSQPSGGGR
jgi:hypothetical protein